MYMKIDTINPYDIYTIFEIYEYIYIIRKIIESINKFMNL